MTEKPHKILPENILDLHNFRPNEVKELIEEFIWSCEQSKIIYGTIVHGKGTGSLRELTHTVLKQSPKVASFRLGDSTNQANWGQTTFELIQQEP